MSLKLPVDDVYLSMLERIEEERDGEAADDLARTVEQVIHENYQAVVESGE